MTREEAIDLLNNLIGMIEDNHNSDYDKALIMAIRSLKKGPCEDAISREEAIKSIKEQFSYGEFYCDEYSIVGLMNNLPPVTPKAESATETWKGYHGHITAPEGTFYKIFNEAKEDDEDI